MGGGSGAEGGRYESVRDAGVVRVGVALLAPLSYNSSSVDFAGQSVMIYTVGHLKRSNEEIEVRAGLSGGRSWRRVGKDDLHSVTTPHRRCDDKYSQPQPLSQSHSSALSSPLPLHWQPLCLVLLSLHVSPLCMSIAVH